MHFENFDSVRWLLSDYEKIQELMTLAKHGKPGYREGYEAAIIIDIVKQLGELNRDFRWLDNLRPPEEMTAVEALEEHLAGLKTIIQHLSKMTYRELFGLFPVEFTFDGSDSLDGFYEDILERMRPSDVDEDTDMDAVVGDNILTFIDNLEFTDLWRLYYVYEIYVIELMKRNNQHFDETDLENFWKTA